MWYRHGHLQHVVPVEHGFNPTAGPIFHQAIELYIKGLLCPTHDEGARSKGAESTPMRSSVTWRCAKDLPSTIPGLLGDSSARRPGNMAVFKAAQQYLRALGYDPGAIDGRDGPKTQRAVANFCEDRGAVCTGIESRIFKNQLVTAMAKGFPIRALR